MKHPQNIDEYIKTFPMEIQLILQQMRETIIKANSSITESISYGMPAFKLQNKPVVYFAGFKNHIGFYATPQAHNLFMKELSGYKQGKGSVQFPIDKPLPLLLIKKITQFKVDSILKSVKEKKV